MQWHCKNEEFLKPFNENQSVILWLTLSRSMVSVIQDCDVRYYQVFSNELSQQQNAVSGGIKL